ncbi:hypothetical protein H1230_09350 [Paenibacillus sp. 19GGS1-52]|uniref:hypothetical protein n=1 Tax=Paenibacillus sp. 19GGS1-52 TaxID=2758563 RepID=UPI001EFA69B2|nr:hypothetical protein [Paenibacillus sp. 19GGS1-52]ULO08951.1 hypothetical protein H1230_09350 [Paenibacillus sp. 19GGS1-52]
MDMPLSQKNCFLCGVELKKHTDEHIFPKWLQNKFNLWDQTITLLNGTEIPYRMLKIPCCNTCNNEYLSQLEIDISKAVDGGYDSFVQLDENKIFYWASKILYGLFLKELSLNIDRKDPVAGTIMSLEAMGKFNTLHMLLQGIRFPTQYVPVKPYSIFIFKMYEYEDSDWDELNFNYFDSYIQTVYGMKMNDIGFILCIEDSGVQAEFGEKYFEKYKDKIIHPIQLKEIFAKISYKQYLANYPPRYITIETDNERVVQVIQPSGDVYKEWSQELYASCLAHTWRTYPNLRFEDIYFPPDRVMSYLNNENGSFKQLQKHILRKIK